MGRAKSIVRTRGPVARFAGDLREARIKANLPTYRQMAGVTGWRTHNVLSEADRGARLPTWRTTEAYLRGLGIPAAEIHQTWRKRWEQARYDEASQVEKARRAGARKEAEAARRRRPGKGV